MFAMTRGQPYSNTHTSNTHKNANTNCKILKKRDRQTFVSLCVCCAVLSATLLSFFRNRLFFFFFDSCLSVAWNSPISLSVKPRIPLSPSPQHCGDKCILPHQCLTQAPETEPRCSSLRGTHSPDRAISQPLQPGFLSGEMNLPLSLARKAEACSTQDPAPTSKVRLIPGQYRGRDSTGPLLRCLSQSGSEHPSAG